MKKVLIQSLILIAIFMMPGCQNNSPTAPAATATPANVEGTVVAVLTNVAIVNATNTKVAQETATAAAGLYTPTLTSTSTQMPNATLTAQAILTVVGAGNATATKQAQEVATAAAGLYTATLTSTSTPSPNQTATAAAIGTMISDIHASETEAVILSRTPTPTITPTITQTWTITDTYTATPTVTPTTTPTYTCTSSTTATVTPTSTSTPTPIPYSDIVSVPGETFTQTDGTNSFSHTISSFNMGKYQVTYNLWYTVHQWAVANGYIFQDAGAEGSSGAPGAAPTTAKYQPVTAVTWRDAIVWCNAYSQMTGLSPVYCSDAGFTTAIKSSVNGSYGSSVNTTAGSFDNPHVNWNANGYRLPTEGEYQYAASYIDGSNWTPWNYASGATADYTDTTATGLVGWWMGNSASTQTVSLKTANTLGIYDMSGNVWEFCWDWYADGYPGTSTNYKGPNSSPYSSRVSRGGSFGGGNIALAVGVRYDYYHFSPWTLGNSLGFRFARTN